MRVVLKQSSLNSQQAMPESVLTGRCIAITRPPGQAAALTAAIEAAGGVALEVPLIEIEPHEGTDYRDLATRLDSFDRVFFVSANAVAHGVTQIRKHRAWPPGPAVATVGPGSARALYEAGFADVLAPPDRFDTEGVLGLPEFSAERIHGHGVLILRGDGGRELLADELRKRGATVEIATCYRRRLPLVSCAEFLRADALTLTSSEAVRHLAGLLREQGVVSLTAKPVFVPHGRIAEAARKAGFDDVYETAGGDVGLMQGILGYYGARS